LKCLENITDIKLKCYSFDGSTNDNDRILNNISKLLYKCPNLTKITLIDFNFDNSILNTINSFPNLVYLDLSNNKISSIKGLNLPKLQYLNVKKNYIIKVNFKNLPMLKYIDISENYINKCYNIHKLNYLSEFKISHNLLKEVRLNNNMKCFDVSENVTLEKIITNNNTSYNLESLNITNTRITDLSFLKNVRLLINLIASKCFLLGSIDVLQHSQYLEFLDISQTPVNSIECLQDLESLQYLLIRNTRIKNINCIPKNLRNLEVSDNIIQEPSFISENLENVNFSNCGLTSIDWLCKNKNLVKVDISHNPLQSIQRIVDLKYLLSLNISFCPITLQSIDDELLYYLRGIIQIIPSDIISILFTDEDHSDDSEDIMIYEKDELVHESSIHKSLINNIMKIEELCISCKFYTRCELITDLTLEFQNRNIEDKNRFLDYILKWILSEDKLSISDDVSITFYYLFNRIWSLIKSSNDIDTLLSILYQEIVDSYGLCFVGLMSRITNTLSGFYNINFMINVKEQLNSIVINEKRKLSNIGIEDIDILKQNFKKRCIELNIDNNEIEEWTKYIDDYQ